MLMGLVHFRERPQYQSKWYFLLGWSVLPKTTSGKSLLMVDPKMKVEIVINFQFVYVIMIPDFGIISLLTTSSEFL